MWIKKRADTARKTVRCVRTTLVSKSRQLELVFTDDATLSSHSLRLRRGLCTCWVPVLHFITVDFESDIALEFFVETTQRAPTDKA